MCVVDRLRPTAIDNIAPRCFLDTTTSGDCGDRAVAECGVATIDNPDVVGLPLDIAADLERVRGDKLPGGREAGCGDKLPGGREGGCSLESKLMVVLISSCVEESMLESKLMISSCEESILTSSYSPVCSRS